MLPSRSPIWSSWSHRHLLLAAAALAAATLAPAALALAAAALAPAALAPLALAAAALALAASALALAAEPFNSQRPDVLVLSSLHHCQRWGMVCC